MATNHVDKADNICSKGTGCFDEKKLQKQLSDKSEQSQDSGLPRKSSDPISELNENHNAESYSPEQAKGVCTNCEITSYKADSGLPKQTSDPKSETTTDSGLAQSSLDKAFSLDNSAAEFNSCQHNYENMNHKSTLNTFLDNISTTPCGKRYCYSTSGSSLYFRTLRQTKSCSSLDCNSHFKDFDFPKNGASQISSYDDFYLNSKCDNIYHLTLKGNNMLETKELSEKANVFKFDHETCESFHSSIEQDNLTQFSAPLKSASLKRQVSFHMEDLNPDLVCSINLKRSIEGPVSILKKPELKYDTDIPVLNESHPSTISSLGEINNLIQKGFGQNSLLNFQNAHNLPVFEVLQSMRGLPHDNEKYLVTEMNNTCVSNDSRELVVTDHLRKSLSSLYPTGTYENLLHKVGKELMDLKVQFRDVTNQNVELRKVMYYQ